MRSEKVWEPDFNFAFHILNYILEHETTKECLNFFFYRDTWEENLGYKPGRIWHALQLLVKCGYLKELSTSYDGSRYCLTKLSTTLRS